MPKTKVKREIYQSRQEVMEAPEELGTPYRIEIPPLPEGMTAYIRSGSNSAAVYDVARALGIEIRTVKAVEMDEETVLERAMEMSPDKQAALLKSLQDRLKSKARVAKK